MLCYVAKCVRAFVIVRFIYVQLCGVGQAPVKLGDCFVGNAVLKGYELLSGAE